jgi:hypothetical protein
MTEERVFKTKMEALQEAYELAQPSERWTVFRKGQAFRSVVMRRQGTRTDRRAREQASIHRNPTAVAAVIKEVRDILRAEGVRA